MQYACCEQVHNAVVSIDIDFYSSVPLRQPAYIPIIRQTPNALRSSLNRVLSIWLQIQLKSTHKRTNTHTHIDSISTIQFAFSIEMWHGCNGTTVYWNCTWYAIILDAYQKYFFFMFLLLLDLCAHLTLADVISRFCTNFIITCSLQYSNHTYSQIRRSLCTLSAVYLSVSVLSISPHPSSFSIHHHISCHQTLQYVAIFVAERYVASEYPSI